MSLSKMNSWEGIWAAAKTAWIDVASTTEPRRLQILLPDRTETLSAAMAVPELIAEVRRLELELASASEETKKRDGMIDLLCSKALLALPGGGERADPAKMEKALSQLASRAAVEEAWAKVR